MRRTLGLIGVPSSAGAHWPGQEKAPRALREAGLVERLESLGLEVFASSPRFAGLTITEFNPDHADEEGTLAAVFTSELAAALAGLLA